MTANQDDGNTLPTGEECQPMQSPATAVTSDFTAYYEKISIYNVRRAELVAGNKSALFAVLEGAGIHTLVVTFNGSGDEGQIKSIEAFAGDNQQLTLPDQLVEHRTAVFGSSDVEVEHPSFREVVDTMAYDFLDQTHNGWGNGDGAYGEFTFTVAGRSVLLNYNERYTVSTNHQHEF